jgi:hypothetical protein
MNIAVMVGKLFGLDAQLLDEGIPLNHRFGRHALAARAHDVDLRGLLVGGKVRLEVEAPDAGVMVDDPAACPEGRAADHVLPCRVACGEVEAEVGKLIRKERIDVLQLGDP